MARLPESLSNLPAGQHRLSREVVVQHQRERVMDAATGVFAKRGYQGTTVDNIVAAARMGVGSFYDLFEGKEDCFLGCFDRIVAAGRERIAAEVDAAQSWPERALAALRALLQVIEANPTEAHLILVEAQTAGPAALEKYEAMLEEAASALRGGRAGSETAGELPPSFEHATVAGVAWLLNQEIVQGKAGEAAGLLPELVGVVLEPYIGKSASAELLAEASANPS